MASKWPAVVSKTVHEIQCRIVRLLLLLLGCVLSRSRLRWDILRVLETIRAGLNQSTPVNAADTLLRLLQGAQPQPIQVEEVPQEDQQEADEAVLDFVDSF